MLGANAQNFANSLNAVVFAQIERAFYRGFGNAPCTNKCTMVLFGAGCKAGIAPFFQALGLPRPKNGATVQGVGAVKPQPSLRPPPPGQTGTRKKLRVDR